MCFSEPSPAFFWIVLIPFPLSLRQGVRVVQKQIAERAGNIARRQGPCLAYARAWVQPPDL